MKTIFVLERSPGEVATIDISTSDQGYFLSSGELRSECFRFLVGILIDFKVGCGTISMLPVLQDS
jgi:hypothetical protein